MKVIALLVIIIHVFTLNIYAQDSLVIDSLKKNSINNSSLTSPVLLNLNNANKNGKSKWYREFKSDLAINYKRSEILKQNLQLNHIVKDENFIDSPWFKVIIGTAISFGASAAYFKNKANHYDELYKKNGSSENLNNRNKYDLYGGIALGALELNVGFLIYKFLTD